MQIDGSEDLQINLPSDVDVKAWNLVQQSHVLHGLNVSDRWHQLRKPTPPSIEEIQLMTEIGCG